MSAESVKLTKAQRRVLKLVEAGEPLSGADLTVSYILREKRLVLPGQGRVTFLTDAGREALAASQEAER